MAHPKKMHGEKRSGMVITLYPTKKKKKKRAKKSWEQAKNAPNPYKKKGKK